MNYEDILDLNKNFQPAYDITNEFIGYWEQFIPNEKFYNILRETLNSLESNSSSERISLWLKGTYGTGKSHATSVIRHILYDPLEQINSFLESISDVQVRSRIKSFRINNKVFPIILKGISNITDNRTFALALEIATKKNLKENTIEISVKSDFETMIEQINLNQGKIDWNNFIKDDEELYMYIKNKSDLLSKLNNYDIEILRILEKSFSKKGINFIKMDICQWLVEVLDELIKQDIAQNIIIYWDEFTSILELDNSSILLTELQHIAELSFNKSIYLFIISHRDPHQTKFTKDEIEKVMGRFKPLDYSMEPITTYHIIEAAIKKKDLVKWKQLRDLSYTNKLDSLITEISITEGAVAKDKMKNLFPIHPITAFISTFIARNIGSTERSIFKFLYDKESGFIKFIKENPGKNNTKFLTSEYLWDFFVSDFERDYENSGSILEKFNLHKNNLISKGNNHIRVFKGILLLNILYRLIRTSDIDENLLVPTKSNLESMFLGTELEDKIEDILNYIDIKEIITKNPDDYYLISTTKFSLKELESEKDRLREELNDICKILNSAQSRQIIAMLCHNLLRINETIILDSNIKENSLKTKIDTFYEKNYTTKIILLISKNPQDLLQIKTTVSKTIIKEEYNNFIFLVVQNFIDEKNYEKYIDYKARENLAQRHNFTEEVTCNQQFSNKIINDAIEKMYFQHLIWYQGENSGQQIFSDIGTMINNELSSKIYEFGLEKILKLKENTNVWTKKQSSKAAELFLNAIDREDFEQNTQKNPEKCLRDLIKSNIGEYIVDEKLVLKKGQIDSHPLIKMDIEIEKVIKDKMDNGDVNFNLGDILGFLTEPPYGLYQNMVNIGAMGFLMRKYLNNFFEQGSGKIIDKNIMKDKVLTLFINWEYGNGHDKLNIRYGSESEKLLIDSLKKIFNLHNVNGLNNVRWQIKNWINDCKHPIWVFKNLEDVNNKFKLAIDKIFNITKSIDIDLGSVEILDSLNLIKEVKDDLAVYIDKEKCSGLFESWLRDKLSNNLKEVNLEEVVKFLYINMQEEISSWEEDRVREKVKDWEIDFLGKKVDTTMQKNEDEVYGEATIISAKEKEEIIQKIMNYKGDLKQALIKIINNFPQIIKYFKENF